MNLPRTAFACLIAASLHAVAAEPEAAPKPEDRSVKAALDRGCQVGVWVRYWETSDEKEEAGVLLSFSGREKALTVSSSARGPGTDLKVLSKRDLTPSELTGLDHWLLQPTGVPDPAKSFNRVLIENPGEKQTQEFELNCAPKAQAEGEEKAAGMNPLSLLAGALNTDFDRERQNPEDPDLIPKIEEIRKKWRQLRDRIDEHPLPKPEEKEEVLRLRAEARTLSRSVYQSVSDALCHAARIRFFQIESLPKEGLIEGDEPGNGIDRYPIVAAKDLTLDEAKPLLAALRERLRISAYPKWMIACYSPHHAVKVWDSHGNVICSGTICTHCSSHELRGPTGIGLSQDGISPALRKALDDLDEKDGVGKK